VLVERDLSLTRERSRPQAYVSGARRRESKLRPKRIDCDLGIEDVLRRLGLARDGSGFLASAGAGQQSDVDLPPFLTDFVAYECAICRHFRYGP
jgi:hypothetical protein